jgi:transposase
LPGPILNFKKHIKKLREFAADPKIDLWATDEVHFQQYGSRCLMWVPPEDKDPILLHYPTRKSVGYFGAVRLRDGKLVFQREEGKFNAVTCHAFLKHLRQSSSRSGRRAIVIIDNARYHHAKLHADWRSQQAPQFILDFLPPYSPDLNPIERLWKLTRKLCLHNRYFPTLEDVVQSVEPKFSEWTSGNEVVRKICAIN